MVAARAVGYDGAFMQPVRGWRRALYLGLAIFFLVLAVLGVLLPVVPATPFLLLTSWFLVRTSPGWNERLYRTRLFGPLLRDWDEHHGVRLSVKVTAIAMVLTGMTTSLVFAELSTGATVTLVAIGALGIGVILRLPLIRDP